MRVNLSGVKTTFEPIPPGMYYCVILEAQLTESKKGNAMIMIKWRVEDPEDHQGRQICSFYVLNLEWHVKNFKKLLQDLEFSDEYTEGEFDLDAEFMMSLEGQYAVLNVVSAHDNDGEPTSNVAKVFPADTPYD